MRLFRRAISSRAQSASPKEEGGMELMRRGPQSSMAGPVLLLLLVGVAVRVASGVVTDGEIYRTPMLIVDCMHIVRSSYDLPHAHKLAVV